MSDTEANTEGLETPPKARELARNGIKTALKSTPLSLGQRRMVRRDMAHIAGMPGFKPELKPLLQRCERLWCILLRLDRYEDDHPDIEQPITWHYKASYENAWRLNMALLFKSMGQDALEEDYIKKITESKK